jgi:hypothetical protein
VMAEAENLNVRRCANEHCNLCSEIEKKTSDDDGWFYVWLRQLKDFEESEELADKDGQVLLMVDHTDHEVRHIRSKLAKLQTQTVRYGVLSVTCFHQN